MLTGVAIAMAVLGAVCFAWAAALQHRAIGQSFENTPAEGKRLLSPRRLWLLIHTRGWLLGTALVAAGAGLHIVGLLMAPVSIIQPVGVLAVPLAVLFAARLSRRRAPGRLLFFALLTVVGIAVFVTLSATHDSQAHTVHMLRVPWAGAILAVFAVGCALLGVFGPVRARCLAWAAAAAAAFGLGSSFLRMDTLLWRDRAGWPVVVLFGVLMVLAWAAGAWFHQQAYASGPPEVVLGALNVVDPLVAVLFGIFVLGEGGLLTVPVTIAMVVVGVLAAAGVVLLSHHHPEARRSRPAAPGPVPVL